MKKIKQEIYEFEKLTKKERLKMPFTNRLDILKKEIINKVVFIPIRKKINGYGGSAVFVESRLGWDRLNDYDCFKFFISDESKYKDNKYIRGDFQYGGVVFFLENGSLSSFPNEFIKGKY